MRTTRRGSRAWCRADGLDKGGGCPHIAGMTTTQTTRQRLAVLIAADPNLTRGQLSAALGVTDERISQLLGKRKPNRARAPVALDFPEPLPTIDLPDRELLEQVITRSGRSVRRFARECLLRDERTARRWLAGALPIPAVVRAQLEAWYLAPPKGVAA